MESARINRALARRRGVLAACGLALAGATTSRCVPDLPADALPLSALCGNAYIDLDAGEQCDPGRGAGPEQLTGCTAGCQVFCPGGYVSPATHHCYQLGSNSSSGDQGAPNICSAMIGAHVVTFASDLEFREVAAWVDLVDSGAFWVGLQGIVMAPNAYRSVNANEPGWSRTCSGCYAHVVDASAPLPRYGVGEAGTVGGLTSTALCVVAFSNVAAHDTWYRSACSSGPVQLHTVCEREPVGALRAPCEAGVCITLPATYDAGKRYVYVSDPAAPEDAEAACASLGGELVVFQSREEREQFWHEMGLLTAPPARLWMGLSQLDGGESADSGPSSWVWDDGWLDRAPGGYPSAWGAGQPLQDAATTRALTAAKAGQVDDSLAFDDETYPELSFVCEIRPRP